MERSVKIKLTTLGAVAVLATAALTGCAATSSTGSPGAGAAVVTPGEVTTEAEFTPTVIMRCGDEQYYLDTSGLVGGGPLPVRVGSLDGTALTLPPAESADGARYSDGELTLWNRGTDWMRVNEQTDQTDDCELAAIGG